MWSFASKSFVLLLLMALIGCGSDSDSEDEGGGDTDNPAQTSAADNLALGTGSGDSFQEGQIDADTTSLSAGGVTSLSFNIVDREDGNTLYSGDPVEVSIGSGCLSAAEPLASLDGPRSLRGRSFWAPFLSERGSVQPELLRATSVGLRHRFLAGCAELVS